MSSLLRIGIVFVLLAPSLAHAAALGNPGNGLFYSGVGVISGWKCEANGLLTVRFFTTDGDPHPDWMDSIPLVYGTERTDVRKDGQCLDNDHDNVGFVAIWNWANLGDGTYTAVVYDNNVEFARSTFEVATLGEAFVSGASGECRVQNFPSSGETTTLEWNQNTQHFEVVGEDLPSIPSGGTFTNSIGMEFVRIEPGRFHMGASEAVSESDEGPVYQVTISQPFYLGKYEVTQAQWQAVMGTSPSVWSNCGNCPVESVSWDDVQGFIEELNSQEGVNKYRLPTEAEWEYAARAGTQAAYHFGSAANLLGFYAWYVENTDLGGFRRTFEVGQKWPNSWNLYDIHGNVWEWVADWYGPYPSGAVTDPRGPSTGDMRIIRGGGFGNDARDCRVARRVNTAPSGRSQDVGFRLVRTP